MGLSNERPKEAYDVVKLLTDVARGFKLFEENGLEKLAKDAYGLSEAEIAKADDARAAISANEAVLSEIKKAQRELDADMIPLNKMKMDIDEANWQLDKKNSELNKRQSELSKQASDLSALEKNLNLRNQDLDTKAAKLEEDKAALAEEKKKIGEYESSLKDKADQIQKLTEGL